MQNGPEKVAQIPAAPTTAFAGRRLQEGIRRRAFGKPEGRQNYRSMRHLPLTCHGLPATAFLPKAFLLRPSFGAPVIAILAAYSATSATSSLAAVVDTRKACALDAEATTMDLRPLLAAAILVICGCTQTPATAPPAASASTAANNTGADAPVSPIREVGAAGVDPAGPTGYHVVERNGIKYYCADKQALGTRIKSRVACLTAEQYEVARQEAINTVREKQGQRQTFE
jgi:hypothetical protein